MPKIPKITIDEINEKVNTSKKEDCKELGLAKWQYIIDNGGNIDYIMCAFCKHYSKINSPECSNCSTCPLHDEEHDCCIEWERWSKRKNVKNAQAVYNKIKALEI